MNLDIYMGSSLSPLEKLPSDPFKMIIKTIGVGGIKSLRLGSKTLRSRIENEEHTIFKHWNLVNDATEGLDINPTELRRFATEVKIVEGLKLYLNSEDEDAWISSINNLLEAHPELKAFNLTFEGFKHIGSLARYVASIGHVLRNLTFSLCSPLEGLYILDSGCLPLLEELKCRGPLSNKESSHLFNLCNTTLKELHLCQMEISEDFIDCPFDALEHLEILDCEKLTGKGLLQLLDQTSKLKVIRYQNKLGSCSLEDCHQSELTIMPKIVKLDLSACFKLTDAGLVSILMMIGQNLKVLDLAETGITGDIFGIIDYNFSPKLETLDLRGCTSLTDSGLVAILSKCGPELKTLTASNTSVSGEAFFGCQTVKHIKLEKLELFACDKLTDLGLVAILSKLRLHLKYICLAFNSSLTGAGFAKLGELEYLNLCGTSVTDLRLKPILEKCGTKLKMLILSCSPITGENLQRLNFIPQLTYLCLESSSISNKGIVNILNMFGNYLKNLSLSGTKITGESFNQIQVNSPTKLEKLKLNRCNNLTKAGLLTIAKKFGNSLRIIVLPYDDGIKKIFYRTCSVHCPKLQRVDTPIF